MHIRANHFIMILLAGLICTSVPAAPPEELSLNQLEQHVMEIGGKLAQLAHYSLGIGAIGYRSNAHSTEDHLEWVGIDLGASISLDEVMLVPAIRRDTEKKF